MITTQSYIVDIVYMFAWSPCNLICIVVTLNCCSVDLLLYITTTFMLYTFTILLSRPPRRNRIIIMISIVVVNVFYNYKQFASIKLVMGGVLLLNGILTTIIATKKYEYIIRFGS